MPVLVLVGIVLLSFNLRGPLVAVSTITGDLKSELGMSGTAVGLLTSLPVLCFGLAAPLASGVIARTGVERAVLISLSVLLVGTLVRSLGTVAAALIGTLVMGLAITVGNVVTPVVIGRDFRHRAAVLTGMYAAAMNIGSMITLTVTGPLAGAFGWQLALAIWGVLTIAAAAVWWPLATRRASADRATADASRATPATGHDSPTEVTGGPSLLHRPTTWMLTIAFAGQAFAYYGLTAWLPTLLADEQGMTRNAAGAASSIFQLAALIGAFGTPLVINRLGGPLAAFAINGVLWASMPLGLLWASDLWPLWSALGGTAQGGGFVAVFTVVVYRSRTLRENRQLSAIIQTGGYTIAALGPAILGGLYDSTGGWSAALLVAFGATVTLTVLGVMSSRGLDLDTNRPAVND